MLGEAAALTALEQGEIGEYQNALEDENVMEEIKPEIRRSPLPRLNGHVTTLRTRRNRRAAIRQRCG
jgi:hypothetical protein